MLDLGERTPLPYGLSCEAAPPNACAQSTGTVVIGAGSVGPELVHWRGPNTARRLSTLLICTRTEPAGVGAPIGANNRPATSASPVPLAIPSSNGDKPSSAVASFQK
jgi:hypothetical protein